MAVIIDTVLGNAGRPRHPEKAHRPDQPSERKPDWIRVKAPVSPGYTATRDIVRANAACTRFARKPAARISASAGKRSTRPS